MSSLPAQRLLLLFLLFLVFLLLLPTHTSAVEGHDGCHDKYLKNVGGDSLVCVCGSDGCPPLLPPFLAPERPPLQPVSPILAPSYTSSRGGLRFKEGAVEVVKETTTTTTSSSSSSSSSSDVTVVEVAVEAPKQVMNGFGGALTDAAALSMSSLSPPSLDALLRAYFSPEGLEYTLLRVPIGGCDFSLTPYTYADSPPSGDDLNFALKEEDEKYKLPLLRRVLGLGRRPPRVVASPWSAPAWMKTNKKINESGELLKEMWQPWADYLVKFIKAYESHGVPIWALTTQNHAFETGIVPWNSMQWSAEDMSAWVRLTLGPTLHQAGLSEVKVYVGDDCRDVVDQNIRKVLNDPGAARYITGVALHWYQDPRVSPQVLERVHLLYPNIDILYTEACIEPSGPGHIPVILGSWARAERYAVNIIENVNHYASGWIDWNMCLDLSGGPNWAGNRVDSPVIINKERDEFYLQPMFFIMGHFSKFVPPGSLALPSWVRVRRGSADLHTAAFLHPDGDVVLQILNTGEEETEVRVEWGRGTHLHTLLPAKALQTLILPWEASGDHEKGKYHFPGAHCSDETCH